MEESGERGKGKDAHKGKDAQKMTATETIVPIVASGFPGGVAPQFYVQYHSVSESAWLSYGSFVEQQDAETCRQRLDSEGELTRIVSQRVYPTAA